MKRWVTIGFTPYEVLNLLQVVDKTLVEWILPDFTTTTTTDMAICSIVMMSTLQSYVAYLARITTTQVNP